MLLLILEKALCHLKYRILVLPLACLLVANGCFSQYDSTKSSNRSAWPVVAGHGLFYGGSYLLLNEAWYKDYPKSGFHTFNDSGEWLQTDKIGHGWSAYTLARTATPIWKLAGLNERDAALAGSLSSTLYLTLIEVLDAHSARWGWSWSDMAANITGSGLYLAQELGWGEQKISFKFSAHKKNYTGILRERADDLFGSSLPERLLKDYNGQTYWLSFNLKSLTGDSRLPPWLNLAIGYGATGMLGGFENRWTDDEGNTFIRDDIKRRRQFYLSPDIDFTRIPTEKKAVRVMFYILNCIKIPAPAIELSDGMIRGRWLYF